MEKKRAIGMIKQVAIIGQLLLMALSLKQDKYMKNIIIPNNSPNMPVSEKSCM